MLLPARVGSLPPSNRARSETSGGAAAAPKAASSARAQLQGILARPPAQPPLPLPGREGRAHAARRCAPRAVGVAARRRAPSALDNGAGLEEKGNLRREAAAGRERGEFTLARVSARAAAAGADEGAPREPVAHPGAARGGQREAGYERACGARSRRAWPAREAAGGAPGAGPRSRAGRPTRSCRPCRDPAMAVSAPGLRGSHPSWGALSLRNALEKPRERGARRGENARALAVWLQSWELEWQGVVSGVLSLSPPISDPQLATPTLCPANPTGARRPLWVCALGQTRWGFRGIR